MAKYKLPSENLESKRSLPLDATALDISGLVKSLIRVTPSIAVLMIPFSLLWIETEDTTMIKVQVQSFCQMEKLLHCLRNNLAAQHALAPDAAPLRFAAAEAQAVGRPAVQLTGGQKWTRQPVI